MDRAKYFRIIGGNLAQPRLYYVCLTGPSRVLVRSHSLSAHWLFMLEASRHSSTQRHSLAAIRPCPVSTTNLLPSLLSMRSLALVLVWSLRIIPSSSSLFPRTSSPRHPNLPQFFQLLPRQPLALGYLGLSAAA
ncbi:uncharacterized protein BDCG_16600 [Blastomyces dermatitidis ER-3]|uniref:Uncharacterized protein n=2 Tax=Ajellomyces dermatitidis TaxID=5039 RepID=F2T3K9_AJEDA|nr:uncharacterized protein BDCG_16600 [Blastomyces dermatitidis ER-3]EEQ87404.2 hypothetical protein BDCG_16600 [Blastomyces dermatitidis ER-3]EGE78011.1 hypothetical protein BDDG_00948 [Blastomyces dermatitidis ATCC 18188]